MRTITRIPARAKLRLGTLALALAFLAAFLVSPVATHAATTAPDKTALPANTLIGDDGRVVATQTDFQAARNFVRSFGGATTDAAPNSVIGHDDRTQITSTTNFPYRAIVHIAVNFPGSSGGCTGWMISPRTLVTAGHCVFENGKWATSMTVTPGKNGNSNPYGTATAAHFYSVYGWTHNGDTNYDYGIVQLNSTIGNTVGWFGFRWQSASLQGTFARITGYPGDKPYGTMWSASGNVNNGTHKLTYTIDTAPGESGSPVYQDSFPNCGVCAIAIHTNGGSTQNAGTRITQAVFNNLMSLR